MQQGKDLEASTLQAEGEVWAVLVPCSTPTWNRLPNWEGRGKVMLGPCAPARTAPRAPVTVPGAFSVRRREELQSTQAAWLSQAEQYENLHLGGYRRIYPTRRTDKYEPFFKQSSSLFQETVSSKAREECARYTAPTETPLTGRHLL